MSTSLLDGALGLPEDPSQVGPQVDATAKNVDASSAVSPEMSAAERIREHVHMALRGTLSEMRVERRRSKRYSFPHPIHLMPVNATGELLRDQCVYVIGKQVTVFGVDFYHAEPVPHRRVVASMTKDQQSHVALLMELNWCRFGRHGYYENGGKFIRALRSPLDLTEAVHWRELAE